MLVTAYGGRMKIEAYRIDQREEVYIELSGLYGLDWYLACPFSAPMERPSSWFPRYRGKQLELWHRCFLSAHTLVTTHALQPQATC